MTKRRRPNTQRRIADARFWGKPVVEAPAAQRFRPTPDPGVVAHSLGPAPLALDPYVVDRHLTAVYEEVVRAATALAAANGLLASEE